MYHFRRAMVLSRHSAEKVDRNIPVANTVPTVVWPHRALSDKSIREGSQDFLKIPSRGVRC